MAEFRMREIFYDNINSELDSIGYDLVYRNVVSDKFRYKNIKIYDLSVAQANILKQTALSLGCDCAVNRDVVTGNVEKSDVILCGSYSQLNKIFQKLKAQPFKLAMLGDNIKAFLEHEKHRTKLAGILNITPDSFSDGGLYINPEDAKRRFEELLSDGADLIDIGAESTRPNSEPVSAELQIERLQPILNFAQKSFKDIKISVDTRSSVVADFALNNGASIINDVSGFDYDSRMPEVAAKYNAGIIIQHSGGNAEDVPVYKNVTDEVFQALRYKINIAKSAGITKIIVDPGIGFGKSRKDNLILLNNIETFYALGYPVMVGISRKKVLGCNSVENSLKDTFTLAYSYPLIQKKVDFLRVHNVKLHKMFLSSFENN